MVKRRDVGGDHGLEPVSFGCCASSSLSLSKGAVLLLLLSLQSLHESERVCLRESERVSERVCTSCVCVCVCV